MSVHPKNIQLVGTATVGPKGQVVIPVEAREKMGIFPGDKVIALYVEDKKTIAFIKEDEMQAVIDRMGAHLTHISDSLKQTAEDTFED